MAKLRSGWIETRPLGDGSFRALLRYRDPLTGSKMTFGDALYGDTQADAVEKAEQLRPELAEYLRNRVNAKREPELMALGDWVLGPWSSTYKSKLPPSTQENMDQWWSKWLAPLVGNTPLGAFTPTLAEGLVAHMQDLGAGWPSVEAAIKYLRKYLRDAVDADMLAATGLEKFRLEAPELTPEEIVALGEPDFAIELEHAVRIAWCMNGLDDTVLAETMCTAALRPGEARALRFDSVLHPDGRPRAQLQVRLAVSGRGSRRVLRGTKKTQGKSKAAIKRGMRTPQIVPALGVGPDNVVHLGEPGEWRCAAE